MDTGRPTKYTDELIAAALEYITSYKMYGDEFPSVVGLAHALDVGRRTLYQWADSYENFKHILETIKSEQERILLNSGLRGDFNSAITKLVLGKHGYHDKQDNTIATIDGEGKRIGIKFE